MDACVREHNRYGGGSVMVWGGIHLHGRTPLHLVQGTLTGVGYRAEIVQPIVIPALQAMGPGSSLTNAHKSRGGQLPPVECRSSTD